MTNKQELLNELSRLRNIAKIAMLARNAARGTNQEHATAQAFNHAANEYGKFYNAITGTHEMIVNHGQ